MYIHVLCTCIIILLRGLVGIYVWILHERAQVLSWAAARENAALDSLKCNIHPYYPLHSNNSSVSGSHFSSFVLVMVLFKSLLVLFAVFHALYCWMNSFNAQLSGIFTVTRHTRYLLFESVKNLQPQQRNSWPSDLLHESRYTYCYMYICAHLQNVLLWLATA